MFSAIRVLSGSRYLLRGNGLPCKVGESWRGNHVVAGARKYNTSTTEACAMGLMLFLSIWSIPFWIVYHIPDYQKENRYEYTGK